MKKLQVLIVTGNYPIKDLGKKVKGILKTDSYRNYEVIKEPEKQKSEVMNIKWFENFVKENTNGEDKSFIIYTYSSAIIKSFYDLIDYVSLDSNLKRLFDKQEDAFNISCNFIQQDVLVEFIDIEDIDKSEISVIDIASDKIVESAAKGMNLLNKSEDLLSQVKHKIGVFGEEIKE